MPRKYLKGVQNLRNNITNELSELEINEIRLRTKALQEQEVSIILEELPSECIERELRRRKAKYISTLDKVRKITKVGDNESLDVLRGALDEINTITKMD